MTPAEQVACDALRSAGLDELADNLAFAREAVKVRATIIKAVTFIGESCDSCISCGSESHEPHDRDCTMLPLLSTQPNFAEDQLRLAWERACAIERTRAPSDMADAAAYAMRHAWGLNDVVTGAMPRTVAGRLDQAAELVRLGTVTPEDYLRVVSGDRAVIVDQPTAVVKPSEFGHE